MAKKFLSPLNLLNLTADPGTATEGDIYWNSTDNKLRVYYNGAWADASSGSGGVAYVAQTSAPSSTDVLWIDTDEPDVLYTAGDGLDSAGLELSVDNTVIRTTTTSLPNVTSVNSTTIPNSKTLVVTTDIGTSVQAYDADLAAIAELASGTGLLKNTSGTWSLDTTSYLSTSTASSTYLPLTGGTISSNLTITGDLTVNGTTTNLNSTNLVIEDKNIILADVASPTNTTADGGGITLKGTTDKTFNWVNSTGYWTSNVGIEASSFVKTSGTSSQFLKADGSIDSSTYLTTSSASSTYAALSSANTFTNNQLISANTSGNALEIRQIGAGNALVVEDEANPDATPFVIDATGAVGIGVAPGTSKINIYDASNANIFMYGEGLVTTTAYRSSTNVTGPVINLRKARGTSASRTAVVASDQLGTINFDGYDGTNGLTAGQIRSLAEGTISTGIVPGVLSFSTANTSGTLTERMRIDSSGNVGIGTTSPATKLDVNGGIHNNSGVVFYKQTNNVGSNGIILGTVDKASAPTGGTGSLTIQSNDATNKLEGTITLFTSATAGSRRLQIQAVEQGVAYRDITLNESGGNVGIGTASPTANTRLTISDTNTIKLRLTGGSTQNGFILEPVSSANQYYVGAGNNLLTTGDRGFLIYDNTNSRAKFLSEDVNGETRVAATTFFTAYTNSVERMRIDSSGNTTINSIAGGTTSTAAVGAGYMGMPRGNSGSAITGAYTITAADAGEHLYVTTTGQTITIPANGTVALPIGTTIVVVNGSGVSTSIAINTDTLRLANSASTGTRTLASNGMCTLLKINTTEWIASGNGLT